MNYDCLSVSKMTEQCSPFDLVWDFYNIPDDTPFLAFRIRFVLLELVQQPRKVLSLRLPVALAIGR